MKDNYLIVGKNKVEVADEVYKGYYKEYERERYLTKLAHKNECSLEGLREVAYPVEMKMKTKQCSAEEEFLQKQKSKDLYQAINSLGEHDGKLIHALFFCDVSEREYGDITGSYQGGVNYKKQRILNQLKNILLNS